MTDTLSAPKRFPFRKLILICLSALTLVGVGAGLSWAVFVKHSEQPIIRRIAAIIPLPAAKVGGRTILYRDFLTSRDTLRIFLNSPAAKEQQLNVPYDAALEKNVLEKLVHQAALEELAEQKRVTVSDQDLRAFFADVITAASTTTPDVGVYLLENFGWNEEDFRQNVLRPALLEERLAVLLTNENQGDPNALALYLEERLQKKDVVRYLRFN